MAKRISQFSGNELVEIILLAGWEDKTTREIRDEFSNLGFTVPQGSMQRALSQARGNWGGTGNIQVIDGIKYSVKQQIFDLPQSQSTLYLGKDGVLVSGLDILRAVSAANKDIPMSLLRNAQKFINRAEVGGRIRKTMRSNYEKALDWVYKNLGIHGSDAGAWIGEASDVGKIYMMDGEYRQVEILGDGTGIELAEAIAQVKGGGFAV